jgi:hypothetical protein
MCDIFQNDLEFAALGRDSLQTAIGQRVILDYLGMIGPFDKFRWRKSLARK